MKTTTQFDYPTAAATSYKAYKEALSPSSSHQQKAHYKQVIRQESEYERSRVKQEEQRKKEKMHQEQQQRIREEI